MAKNKTVAAKTPPDEARRGRPPYYDTPEDIQPAIDAYFVACEMRREPFTITGLALALGFSSRQSLDDAAKRPGFSDVIKRAKLRVENGYEIRALGNNPTGAIFCLKNMGWEDKQQREHSGELNFLDRVRTARGKTNG